MVEQSYKLCNRLILITAYRIRKHYLMPYNFSYGITMIISLKFVVKIRIKSH